MMTLSGETQTQNQMFSLSNPKSALRAERADAILLQMVDPYASGELDTKAARHHLLQHYLLSCWVKSPWNGSTEKAEKILCEMQALYALVDKGVKPDAVCTPRLSRLMLIQVMWSKRRKNCSDKWHMITISREIQTQSPMLCLLVLFFLLGRN